MQPQTFLRSACAGVEAGSACLQGLAQKKKFIGYSGAVIVFVLYSNANPAHGSQLIQGDNVSIAFQYVSGGPPREIPALPRGAMG